METTNTTPRFMIAAPHSGSGKTSLTCGILRLLQRRSLDIASFKCGPDYIDPMFHRRVLRINSINLDTYFTGEAGTRALFARHSAGRDVSVIEGVMGFFDGLAGTETTASSYDLARVTDTPVILVVDTKGMSRSVVPLIKGFLEYDPAGTGPLIRGVILNRMSGMLYPKIKALIEKELPVRVLGYVPVTDKAGFGSRHLGLMQADEIADFQAKIDGLADVLEETLDLEGILELAGEAGKLDVETCGRSSGSIQGARDTETMSTAEQEARPSCRIGVARDEAFTFYYADNLEILESFGAEIVPFSPLRDKELPAVDGLLLGGGYPELRAEELEANESMRAAIKAAAEEGMPVLAECGGFMYLQEGLRLKDGKTYKMCGAIPGETAMTEKLVRFGYMELKAATAGAVSGSACPYLPLGETIRGHEFHYFDSTDNGDSCVAEKPVTGRSWPAVVCRGHLMAGFPHLYYASNPAFARRFVEACRRFSER